MIMELFHNIIQLAKQSSLATQVSVATVACMLIFRWVTKRRYKLPPGPRPLPLLGNILVIRKGLLDALDEWIHKYGPILTLYMGPQMVVVLNNFESMTEAFVKNGSDFSSRPLLYSCSLVSDGFKDITLSPYGDDFKYLRKITSQALRQYLTGKQLENRVNETLHSIIEKMKQETGAFNPHRFTSLAIFNVLHGLCFGTTLQIDDPKFEHLLDSFDSIEENVGGGLIEDFFPPARYWPTQKFKDTLMCFLEFNNYVLKQLQEQKASFQPDKIKSLTGNILLAQQQALMGDDRVFAANFTDDHAKQVLVDVFRAGVGTSRVVLDWLFLVLVAKPDVQKKMQEEIDNVVGDAIPGKEHRSKLVYTEAVIMETMRLYYVAPLGLPHETLGDTTVGGYEIPEKVTVLVNYIALMRDPNYWPDPLKFKPERFIVGSEDGTGSSKIASSRQDGYAPFSMGHRSCLGESLAKLELVYLVAGLLQNLTFSFASQGGAKTPDFEASALGLAHTPKPYCVKVISRKD